MIITQIYHLRNKWYVLLFGNRKLLGILPRVSQIHGIGRWKSCKIPRGHCFWLGFGTTFCLGRTSVADDWNDSLRHDLHDLVQGQQGSFGPFCWGLSDICENYVRLNITIFLIFFFFCRLSDQEIGKTLSHSLAKRLLLPLNSFAAWSFNCTFIVQAVILHLVSESTWWSLPRWFRWQWSWLLRNCDDSISINIEWISRKRR